MKILVVRRDNIGDLVLTTPVFAALRRSFPGAAIEVLANSYSAPILDLHPDVDHVHVYTKTKHRGSRWSAPVEWAARLRQVLQLRERGYDYVILPNPGIHPRQIRLARWLGPRHIVAFVPPGESIPGVDHPVAFRGAEGHHLEDTFRILAGLGINGPPPPPRLGFAGHGRARPSRALRIGVHVSARKERSRWPEAHHAHLMRQLYWALRARFRLFWAPGAENDPRHPADDERAARVLHEVRDIPVEALRTDTLHDLVAGIAACDAFVCSDGGAMHVAAALGKPVVCFFGDSSPAEWHPWQVPYRLLQPRSRDARDIPVEQAVDAFLDLAYELGLAPERQSA